MVQKQAVEQNGREEQANGNNMRLFWRQVWKANVTERIKVLVWRLFYDALPDAKNLSKRGCGVNTECVGCGWREESALHTVRDCWKARALWSLISIEEKFVSVGGGNAADWLFWCASVMNKKAFRKIMCGLWLLWSCRNEVVHGKLGWSIEEMAAKIESLNFQFDEFLGRKLRIVLPNILLLESDRSKDCIFCDGSWKASGGEVGLAAIMTNSEGVQATCFKWIESGVNGIEAEGRALCLGMEMAEQRDIREVVIISDALDVVNAIYLGCDRRGGVGSWIKKGRELLSKHPEWSVKHTMREGNVLADRVAHFSLENRATWLNVWAIPRSLAGWILMNDSLD